MAATTSHYHQPVTSTASDDSNDDIRAERGGRRRSSGLLVEGEDRWQCVMVDDYFGRDYFFVRSHYEFLCSPFGDGGRKQ